MGRAIATELARLGSTVVIVARTVAGGEQARRQIAAEAGGGRVELLTGDLASLADLRRVADRFTAGHRALHVLVNNAGAHYRQRSENADGIEMHLAVNHLAGFSLTNLLLDPLRGGAPSRVVNVVSAAMADTRQIKIRRWPRPVTLDLRVTTWTTCVGSTVPPGSLRSRPTAARSCSTRCADTCWPIGCATLRSP